jgi:phage gp29-like protein
MKFNPFHIFKEPAKTPDYAERTRTASDTDVMAYRWSNANTDVDQVFARQGYSLYTSKMMQDDSVKSCVLIKKLGVVVGGWSVNPAVGEGEEGYDEAAEVAEFVEYALSEMSGSLETVILNIVDAIVPGFSVNEILWKLYDSGPYSGKVGISKIKKKPAPTFTFDMDPYGNVLQLLQTIGTEQKVLVPLEKVLLYTYDPQGTGLPQGVSDLRAAYRHYWSKEALMRWRNVAAEKYAAPTPKGTYPQTFTKAMQDALLRSLSKFQTDTAIIVPEGAEVELLSPNGSVMAPYDASIDSCNKGIARAIFGQVLATDEGSGGSGSYAQAKIHKGILGYFLQSLCREISEQVLKEQLVKRLVDYNFQTQYYPEIILHLPDDRDLESLANIMNVLLTQGVLSPKEPQIRELFGLDPMPRELADEMEAEEEEEKRQEEERMKALQNAPNGNNNQDADNQGKNNV